MPIVNLELKVLIPDGNGEPEEGSVTFRSVLEFPAGPPGTIVIFIVFLCEPLSQMPYLVFGAFMI